LARVTQIKTAAKNGCSKLSREEREISEEKENPLPNLHRLRVLRAK